MIRFFRIVVFSCAASVLTGCNAHEKSEPIWQQVKITDLAPPHSAKQPDGQLLKTINFDVCIFEIPAENIGALDDVWQMLQGPHFARSPAKSRKMGPLYTKPFRFNDYNAFTANSFLVGFGQIQTLNKIDDLLRAADGKKIKTVSLLLTDGQANDIDIARLYNEQTVFYVSSTSSMEGATVGPGTFVLRIKAEKIPGFKSVCNVDVLPVSSPPMRRSITQLAGREKTGELLFTSAGFKLKMRPGDLFFLGPGKYISNQITLASLFFSRPRRQPVVRTYLIICGRINY